MAKMPEHGRPLKNSKRGGNFFLGVFISKSLRARSVE